MGKISDQEQINKAYVVKIHNKKYMMVAGRVLEAHRDAKETLSISTEIVETQDEAVIFKATVEIDGLVFTGHAVSNFNAGGVEGGSPFEVAETSAVGRALGFAGFGLIGDIATAEEIQHADKREGQVIGFHGSKNEKYKEVFSRVVKAQVFEDINEVMQSDDYKGLDVEEKRGIQARIKSKMLNLKGEKDE